MSRLIAWIEFIFFYITEILKSNLRVAHDVLTPEHKMTPGIIVINVAELTDGQISLMANFITMTPGTLGLAVSDDHTKLYIHAMYLDAPADEVAEQLFNDYGKRVQRVVT